MPPILISVGGLHMMHVGVVLLDYLSTYCIIVRAHHDRPVQVSVNSRTASAGYVCHSYESGQVRPKISLETRMKTPLSVFNDEFSDRCIGSRIIDPCVPS